MPRTQCATFQGDTPRAQRLWLLSYGCVSDTDEWLPGFLSFPEQTLRVTPDEGRCGVANGTDPGATRPGFEPPTGALLPASSSLRKETTAPRAVRGRRE